MFRKIIGANENRSSRLVSFFFFFYTFRFFLQLLKRVDLEKVDGGFFLLDRKDITTTLLLSINRV